MNGERCGVLTARTGEPCRRYAGHRGNHMTGTALSRRQDRKRRWTAAHPTEAACRKAYDNAKRAYGPGVTYAEFRVVWLGTCFGCGLTPAKGVDHIIGRENSGTNNLDNLQPGCLSCNSRKAQLERWNKAVPDGTTEGGSEGSGALDRPRSLAPKVGEQSLSGDSGLASKPRVTSTGT